MYFKFCPVCGSKSLTPVNKNLIQCQDCKFEWYQNPKPAANCICIDPKHRILLAKRARPPKQGQWGVPGGFVDAGDNLELAAIREMKEELDIDLAIDRLKYITSDKDKYLYQKYEYDTVGVLFEVRLSFAEIDKLVAKDDVSEFKFFQIDQIPWQDLAFKSTARSLKEYLKTKALNPSNLKDLRTKIDLIDRQILEKLATRKEIVQLIGQYKKQHNLEILDQKRWQEVKQKIEINSKKLGLDYNIILSIWEKIHDYSKELEK